MTVVGTIAAQSRKSQVDGGVDILWIERHP